MKYYFIINPAAGKSKRKNKFLKEVKSVCEAQNVKYELYFTQNAGDAIQFVKSHADEESCFFACGGDGTVNEVINGIATLKNVQFGVIPIGSGNDFIRTFGYCSDFVNISKQLNAKTVPIDLITCNGQYSVNVLNLGFDCDVCRDANRLKEHSIITNKLSYIMGVVMNFVRKMGFKAKIIIDGMEIPQREFLLCAIGNGQYYGGGFRALPRAKVSDGKLDVCLVDKVPRLKFIQVIPSYKKGKHYLNPKYEQFIHCYSCESLKIVPEKRMDICYDGEIVSFDEFDIHVVPGAIQFRLPV